MAVVWLLLLWPVTAMVSLVVRDPLLGSLSLAAGVAVVALGALGKSLVDRIVERRTFPWGLMGAVARHPSLDGYRELLAAMVVTRDRTTLAQLGWHPALAHDLIRHARLGRLRPEIKPFTTRVRRRRDPLAWALASLDTDGYVREAAVTAMAARPRPEFVPFLVERSLDWVPPVRECAFTALCALLAAQPSVYGPLVRLELPRIERRKGAGRIVSVVPGG
ncbi:hypothetical protein Ahu01nite_012730 [Winogradskya humida]|uniref:HEAT repeat protein n=1 Tax=Winogradskya humida TaxID=113566 RepID=A0ABQ3ZHW3_9ACTN|nr:hypothetical protein Ahu01nite_012730 [Actinoplanes humidus]